MSDVLTLAEHMGHGISEVDPALVGIVGDAFE
jgi:hypothetical protein